MRYEKFSNEELAEYKKYLADGELFSDISSNVTELQVTCYEAARASGWWNNPKTDEPITPDQINTGEKLMLIVSEVSEAMEADRKGLNDDHLPNRDGLTVELADALIRIFDFAGGMGLDLPGAVAEKLQYNASRADHKPENRIKEGGKKY